MKSGKDHVPTLPQSILLLGQPGAGKTTFALQLPKPFLLDCDANLSGPARFLSEKLKGKDWWYDTPLTDEGGVKLPREKRFVRAVDLLNQALESKEVETIVVDSLTTFADFLMDHVRSTQKRKLGNGRDTVDEPMQIQDWGIFSALIRKVIFDIKASGKRLVFCAHIAYDKDELTGILQKFINLPGGTKNVLSGWFEESWELFVDSTGAGPATKATRKIRTVGESRASALGLKSAIGLPVETVADADAILSRITK